MSSTPWQESRAAPGPANAGSMAAGIKRCAPAAALAAILAALGACGGSGGGGNPVVDGGAAGDAGNTDNNTVQGDAGTPGVLHGAYGWFNGNVTVNLNGYEVVIEATGRPNHTSAYWNPNNASGLYVAPDPEVTDVARMSPGYIEDYNNLFSLRVPSSPRLAAAPSATSLGPVGLSVSGAPIFNDEEGANRPLNIGVISGFDRNGAHTGPSTYHYHLEPRAISNDDEELIGVMADGFFIYGRKCYSTPGAYPDDLDDSGGHVSATRHSSGAEEYHYHIKNEFYLGSYYLLFPEDYRGSPNAIGR
ncbi:MAG: YHYH protein [Acidobacteriota bacterium]|nr:YHYH protein [Acidobacteriota bacterium]